MQTLDLLEASTHFFRLVEALETGIEDEILITRQGRPVVRLTALDKLDVSRRIGVAKGRFEMPLAPDV